jgi:hypothetical protein
MHELNLRVGMQSRMGTTFLWNKMALTAEQGSTYVVSARLVKEGVTTDWVQPRVVRPPLTGNLATVVDAETDFIMIPHVVTQSFNERVTFDVQFVFGQGEDKRTAVLRVDPFGQHTQFVKNKRIDYGPDRKPGYAYPVSVEDVSDLAVDKIAGKVADKVVQALQKEPPK